LLSDRLWRARSVAFYCFAGQRASAVEAQAVGRPQYTSNLSSENREET